MASRIELDKRHKYEACRITKLYKWQQQANGYRI